LTANHSVDDSNHIGEVHLRIEGPLRFNEDRRLHLAESVTPCNPKLYSVCEFSSEKFPFRNAHESIGATRLTAGPCRDDEGDHRRVSFSPESFLIVSEFLNRSKAFHRCVPYCSASGYLEMLQKSLSQIEHVPPTSAPRTNLKNTSSPDQHGNHGSIAFRARRGSVQFGMAMGTEEVDYGTAWDVMFLIDRKTPVQAGETEPALFIFRKDSDTDRRITVNVVTRIHEAVVATRATDFDGKNSLVRLNVDHVETHTGLVKNVLDLCLGHIGEIVAVDDNDRA
jgi:hypothetical protein